MLETNLAASSSAVTLSIVDKSSLLEERALFFIDVFLVKTLHNLINLGSDSNSGNVTFPFEVQSANTDTTYKKF